MPAGLRILNDSGTVQIDENYKNLVLIAKNTQNTYPVPPFGPVYSILAVVVDLPQSVVPVIAVQSQYPTICQWLEWNSAIAPNKWYATIVVGATFSSTCSYYVFAAMPVVSPTGPGLAVWNASGEPTFSNNYTNNKLMKIRDFVDISSANYGTRTYESGRSYAWCTATCGYYWKPNGGNLKYAWGGCAAPGGNSVTFSEIIRQYGAGSFAGGVDRFIGMVVDVTGY